MWQRQMWQRYMKNNTQLMFDCIDYADCYDEQSTTLSLDICAKLLDSLKWEFVLKVFESYGFGDKSIRC